MKWLLCYTVFILSTFFISILAGAVMGLHNFAHWINGFAKGGCIAFAIVLLADARKFKPNKRIRVGALSIIAAGIGGVAFDPPSFERIPLILTSIVIFGWATLIYSRQRQDA
jgi:hypothetical protein